MTEAQFVGGTTEVGSEEAQPPQSQGGDAFHTMLGTLPEQLRQNPHLTRQQDFGSFAKEYVNLVSKIGEKGIIPPKGDDPNDRARFYKELGRPESPDQYNFEGFEKPDGVPWNDEVGAELVAAMHEVGLTNEQAPKLVQKYAEIQERLWNHREAAGVQANQHITQTLQKELGAAYGEKMNLAYRATSEVFGGPEKAEEILATRLENGVALGDFEPFVRAMLKLTTVVGEEKFVSDETKGIPGAKTPADAKAEYDQLMADPEFKKSYLDNSHPNHKLAIAKVDELYEYMRGEGAIAQVGVNQPGMMIQPRPMGNE